MRNVFPAQAGMSQPCLHLEHHVCPFSPLTLYGLCVSFPCSRGGVEVLRQVAAQRLLGGRGI